MIGFLVEVWNRRLRVFSVIVRRVGDTGARGGGECEVEIVRL
jgi:hypothetical protein